MNSLKKQAIKTVLDRTADPIAVAIGCLLLFCAVMTLIVAGDRWDTMTLWWQGFSFATWFTGTLFWGYAGARHVFVSFLEEINEEQAWLEYKLNKEIKELLLE